MATTKEKTLALVAASGWILDPDVTWNRSGYLRHRESDQEQNPYAFMKPGPDGGTWHLYLNYVKKQTGWSSYRYVGDTLREATFSFTSADGEKWTKTTLKNTDNLTHGVYNQRIVWQALREYKPNGNSESLTEVAAKLIKDPTTAIWLTFQAQHDDQVRRASERAAEREDERARKQPLPIVIPEGTGYQGQWRQLTWNLKAATDAIHKADGKSDLPQLVTDAILKLEAIQAVLTDESRQVVDANLYEVHSGLAAFRERQE